jgi:hypothetical protein
MPNTQKFAIVCRLWPWRPTEAHHLVHCAQGNGIVLRVAALWIVFLGLYLFFAAPVSSSELIAGIPSAAAITAFALHYRRAEDKRMDLRAPWMRVILRTLKAVPGDVLRVGGVLVVTLRRAPKREIGAPSRQPFREGDDTAADAVRRALVVLGTSLAPNGYVLMMPQGSETIVLHRLVRTAPNANREWPI